MPTKAAAPKAAAPKAVTPKAIPKKTLTKVELSCGFVIEIDENLLDDAELIEDLIAIDEGDQIKGLRVLFSLLGEQKAALYDHLRTPEGRVPFTAVSGILGEIVLSLQSKKN